MTESTTESEQTPVNDSTKSLSDRLEPQWPTQATAPVEPAGLDARETDASGDAPTQATLADSRGDTPKCPVCNEPMERIARTIWMRVLVSSKRYYCRHCRESYLQFLERSFPL